MAAAHDAYDLEGFHGAANVYLSARDLHKWLAGYRRVVPPQALRNARRPARLDDGRTSGISLGSWYLSPDTKRRYYTGHHNGFFSVAYADDARDLTVAWVANDAPPAWLQPALTRALITIAEGGAPETLAPPPVRSDAVTDITGAYGVPETLGEVRVRRDGERLIVRVRGVPYDAFAVGGDTHYVPGLDAYLRFGTSASGVRALRWDSIYAVEPSVPRRAPRRCLSARVVCAWDSVAIGRYGKSVDSSRAPHDGGLTGSGWRAPCFPRSQPARARMTALLDT